MKKLLFWILTFLWIWLSFCSADWIYWNQNSKLISVVINWQTKYTLQDRNIGATCMNVNDSCSYGNYYQWWNNYWFWDSTYSNSSTSTDLDWYGPWNYFNSNWIWYSYSNSYLNPNAWGFASWTFEDAQGPCPVWYNVPQRTQFISDVDINFWILNGSQYKTYFFIPYAWTKVSNSSVSDTQVRWLYWSNRLVDWSVNGFFSHNDNNRVAMWDTPAWLWLSVRCFKNEVVIPTSKRTRLTWDIIESIPTIIVNYNNWNSSQEFECDWENSININWLSTLNNDTFSPYYNIAYRDEDNQSLIESYSKDILYLNWLFKKTYTWDNERILTSKWWGSENSFSWYLPTFEFTWWINEPTESWNIFNNFAENSVKFTLSNIPSYIQYVILLFILFFILGFIRKFRRK